MTGNKINKNVGCMHFWRDYMPDFKWINFLISGIKGVIKSKKTLFIAAEFVLFFFQPDGIKAGYPNAGYK